MLTTSCTTFGDTNLTGHEETNSVYYWKTVFHLDSADRAFINKHDIGRIYMRMFDVAHDNGAGTIENRTYPNATIRFDYDDFYLLKDSLDDLEFVPVVYITLDAMKAMENHEGVLASNIVTRIRNMCSYNAIHNVEELQLDCDWTKSTRQSFFTLCDSVRQDIEELGLPWRLSSTIRLHQLSQDPPPVNNGVLMVYNTGSFNDPDAQNSIIDAKDVAPYMKYLSRYPLHLDVAYPTYSWQLLFHKRSFVGLISGLNLNDSVRYTYIGNNSYEAKCDIPYKNMIINKGDIIREETSPFNDIAKVRAMIEDRLSNRSHSNILYHLDTNNLSNYSSDEIDKILASGL